MCELAVREAVPALLDGDLEAMREANHRFTAALESGDVEAALRTDDESHGVPVRIAGNRALATVLEQFTPTVRRAERFASLRGRAGPPARRADPALRHQGRRGCGRRRLRHLAQPAERREMTTGAGRHGAMTSSAMRSPSIAKQ